MESSAAELTADVAPRSGAHRKSHATPAVSESGARWLEPAAVGVVAAAVSAVLYWRPSFWTDEVATVSAADRTWPQLWTMLHHVDAVHGLYYAFMHVWLSVFGVSELSMRAPSVIATGVAAAGVVVLGRALTSRRVSLLAGFAFAVLPRVTWMGTEARSYAMTAALAVWAAIAMVSALRFGRWRWLVYSVLMTVGVYLFAYFLLILLGHALTVAWSCRQRVRALLLWGVAALVPVLASVPLMGLVLKEAAQIGPVAPSLKNASAHVLIFQWFLGQLPDRDQLLRLSLSTPWTVSCLLLAAFAWALMAWVVLRRGARPPRAEGAPVGLLALVLPWILVPTVLLLAYSFVATPIYAPHYLTYTTPAVALLLGAALAAIGRKWLLVTAGSLLVVLALPVYLSQRSDYAKRETDWAAAAHAIGARAVPGDVVVFGRLAGQEVTTRKVEIGYPGPMNDLRDVTLDQTGAGSGTLWGTSKPLAAVAGLVNGAARVWVVVDSLTPYTSTASPERKVLSGLGYHVIWSWSGPSTAVYELTR